MRFLGNAVGVGRTSHLKIWGRGLCLALLMILGIGLWAGAQVAPLRGVAEACCSSKQTTPRGAIDGERFSVDPQSLWQPEEGIGECWWSLRFPSPQLVGSILQIHGDGELTLRQAPTEYVWQGSVDGEHWEELAETRIVCEKRTYRIHRLARARELIALRLWIRAWEGTCPVLREVEVYPSVDAAIEFPDWAVIIFTDVKVMKPPDNPQLFVQLIRECPEWKDLRFQQVSYRDVDEVFVATEPRPLCGFLTGSVTEWCQVPPETWRGFEQVFKSRNLPLWGACGGAQVLAILWEHGTGGRWDCPRCRDPQKPLAPVYKHIGHTGPAPCGDYSKNIGERGKYQVRLVAQDPVFDGVPELFETMEAHYGEIAYVPEGWVRIVTKGPAGLTENQCLRLADRYIYAAQFHIELPGTPETSRRIVSNFLRVAKEWGGYNPAGKPVPPPVPFSTLEPD